jgi:hypothetical protein
MHRYPEQQRYRASGLNLLTSAIVLRNTVYLDRTFATLTSNGGDIDPDLLRFLSALGWEHINLTGGYTWPRASHIKPGNHRREHPVPPLPVLRDRQLQIPQRGGGPLVTLR